MPTQCLEGHWELAILGLLTQEGLQGKASQTTASRLCVPSEFCELAPL